MYRSILLLNETEEKGGKLGRGEEEEEEEGIIAATGRKIGGPIEKSDWGLVLVQGGMGCRNRFHPTF